MITILRQSITLLYLKLLLASFALASQTSIEALNAEITARHVSCFGAADGSAELVLTGGVAPFTYEWSNGSEDAVASNLSPGSYSVTVTDATGAIATACIEINQPAALTVQANAPEFLCTGASANITIVVSGGTAPYTYIWLDGISGNTRVVSSGSYSVTVTDAKGCSETNAFSITDGGSFDISVSKTDVSCFGNYDGSASVDVVGDTEYTYSWSNGAGTSSISGVPAGPYSVTVSDEAGCIASDTILIKQPESLHLSTELLPVSCTGGGVDVTVLGGVQPYKYFWTSGARTEDLSGLTNGNYFLSVTDANGCIKSTSVTVSGVNLMTINSSIIPVSCSSENDGAVGINVSGGVAPFTYSWSNGLLAQNISGLSTGTYTVTVTDANNCSKTYMAFIPKDDPFDFEVDLNNVSCHNAGDGSIDLKVPTGSDLNFEWSNGATGSLNDGLQEGDYSVVITTPGGCEKTMEFHISNPLPLQLSISTLSDPCASGSIDLSVSGGEEPYDYNWSTGATSEDITGVSTGTYSVIVTDANSCVDSTDTYIQARPLTTVTVSTSEVSCNGLSDGTASVAVNGDNGPYKILWSNNSSANDISNLTKGNYSVTVTDNYGCEFTRQVSITEPADLNITLVATNPSCHNSDDGLVRSLVRGGTSPYTFTWNAGGSSGVLTRLVAGTYSLTVSDSKGCSDSASTTLVAPPALQVTSDATANCKGGAIDLSIEGGSDPYAFLWSDGSVEEDRINLIDGQSYSVQVSDSKGCNTSHDIIVPEYEDLLVTVQVNGRAANSIVSGGSAPYTFLWSTGHNTSQVADLPVGVHRLTVTDAAGCSSTASFEIETITSDPLSATIDCCQDEAICRGEQTAIPVYFTGSGPFTFSYLVGKHIKSITTTDNPYYITETIEYTTTFKLISVTNGCSSGPVCGQATIGVNDCGTRCEMTCFSAEVVDMIDYGDCRDIKLKIISNGNCKYGLSHLSISTPCGKAKDIHNSRGFQVEKGEDPTTKIRGFKIDNVSSFGESKNGKEEFFYVEYTLCKKDGECFGEFCPPLISFKASTCAYYVKAGYKQEPPILTPISNSTDSDKITVFPNPASKSSVVRIQMPSGSKGAAEVVLVDSKGNERFHAQSYIDDSTWQLEVILPEVEQGMYMVIVRKDGTQFFQKLFIN